MLQIDETQHPKPGSRQSGSDSGYAASTMRHPSSDSGRSRADTGESVPRQESGESISSGVFSSFDSPTPSPSHKSQRAEFKYSKEKNQRFEYDSNDSNGSTNGYGNHSSCTVSRRDSQKPPPSEYNFANVTKCLHSN